MRYLGIDYGRRRIGLALSDAAATMAFPYGVVARLADVLRAVEREGVEAIVIGDPQSLAGRATAESRAVRRFAAELTKRVQLPVEFEDERFTTKIARRTSPRAKADASAAAIILQSYLDKILSSKP